MTKNQQNNNQGTGYLTEIKIMISVLLVISGSYHELLLKNYLYHGDSGIARRKKRSSSVDGALLPIVAISTLIGSNARSLAVRSMVMMIETLRLPLSVILPKLIFLNMTAFLTPCSVGLFAEGTAGYLRIFKSIRKLCFELGVSVFKFFDAFLKFKCLMIANIHSKFKLINSFTEIVSFRENAGKIFAVKKNTEVFKWTIGTFDMFRTIILSFLSNGVFLGKVKQNPTMQTRKLSATDCLIIVYNKIIVKARNLNKLQKLFRKFLRFDD